MLTVKVPSTGWRTAPGIRLLGLVPVRIQVLAKITLSVYQRNRNDRQFKIRRGSKHVSRQYPQASAVGRNGRIQRDLHRKVRDLLRHSSLVDHAEIIASRNPFLLHLK